MSAEILKEYLLSIGFKIDETSSKKFDGALTKQVLSANLLTKAVTETAKAVYDMTVGYVQAMERLYYSTKLGESSATNIKALSYAASRLGVNGEVMTRSLEGMARQMRMNPGLQGLIEGLGIPVRGRDKSEVLVDMLKAFKQMPFEIGARYAELFGLDPDTFKLLTDNLGELEAGQRRYKELAKEMGADLDANAKSGQELANIWRDLKVAGDIFWDSIMTAALPVLKEFAGVTMQVLGDWTRLLKRLSDRSWKQNFQDLGEALGILKKDPNASGVELSQYMRSVTPSWIDKGGRRAGGQVTTETSTPAAPGAPAVPGFNYGNLRSWGNSPISGGFAQFGSAAEGMSALAGNLVSYAKKGRNTIRSIIEHWAPKKDKNDTETYIKNMAGWLGVDDDTTLDMTDPMTLAALMKGITRQEHSLQLPTSAFLGAAQERLRGVTIEQKTYISVSGAESPGAVAAQVARQQDAVNANLVRNAKGAIE